MGNSEGSDRKAQLERWHTRLEHANMKISKTISGKISKLSQDLAHLMDSLVKAIYETKVIESFIEHIYISQKELADDMKEGLKCNKHEFVSDDSIFNNDSHSLNSETLVSSASLAAASMRKSTQLMIDRIEKLGMASLNEARDQIRNMLKTLITLQNDLQQFTRTATNSLLKSQLKIHQAWDLYFSGVTNAMHSITHSSPINNWNSNSDHERRQPHQRELVFSRNNNTINERSWGASHPVSKGSTCDVWFSEWRYRSKIMEQAVLWGNAVKRAKEFLQRIQENEVSRRIQLTNLMIMVAQSQQKMAVNFEVASAISLVEYWEGQEQMITSGTGGERTEAVMDSNDETESLEFQDMFGSVIVPAEMEGLFGSTVSLSNTISDFEAFPPFHQSSFLTLTALVKRDTMEGLEPILSMTAVTVDGILYFFDLPKNFPLEFRRSTSPKEVWQALMADEFKRQLARQTSFGETDFGISVLPPLPSLKYVLAQCSVEMTQNDLVVLFHVPKSREKDFQVEFTSSRRVIEFIDAFHTWKLQHVDSDDLFANFDDKGSETDSVISDVSGMESDCDVEDED